MLFGSALQPRIDGNSPHRDISLSCVFYMDLQRFSSGIKLWFNLPSPPLLITPTLWYPLSLPCLTFWPPTAVFFISQTNSMQLNTRLRVCPGESNLRRQRITRHIQAWGSQLFNKESQQVSKICKWQGLYRKYSEDMECQKARYLPIALSSLAVKSASESSTVWCQELNSKPSFSALFKLYRQMG